MITRENLRMRDFFSNNNSNSGNFNVDTDNPITSILKIQYIYCEYIITKGDDHMESVAEPQATASRSNTTSNENVLGI